MTHRPTTPILTPFTPPDPSIMWHPVPGYVGLYEANRAGDARSMRRKGHTNKGPWLLRGHLNAAGQRVYTMGGHGEGTVRARRIKITESDLVAAVFHGALMPLPPEDEQGREEWRAIPGYVGLYEVSRSGRVRSLMITEHKRRVPEVLKGIINAEGRRTVRLEPRLCDGREIGKATRRRRHRDAYTVADLVAMAFEGRASTHSDGVDTSGVPDADRVKIELSWSRRHLRRYPSVTLEILADEFRQTKKVIRALIDQAEQAKMGAA